MSTTLQRQFVLIGLDGIGPSVFQSLPTDWHITVVDTDLNKLNDIPIHGENVKSPKSATMPLPTRFRGM